MVIVTLAIYSVECLSQRNPKNNLQPQRHLYFIEVDIDS